MVNIGELSYIDELSDEIESLITNVKQTIALEQEKKQKPIELNEFVLPKVINNDHEYSLVLERELENFLDAINGRILIDENTYEQTLANSLKILDALQHYFNADISKAKSCIYEILEKYIKNPFIVSPLNDSTAFRGLTKIKPIDSNNPHPAAIAPIRMFRARVGVGNYTKKDFLHIPFNRRGNVSTQRFSIAGVPCMYFGLTSYVCWLELGKPQTSEFNVSAYVMPDNLKILNLAISQGLLNGLSNHAEYKELVQSMVQLFPLIIATSFKVKELNRSFKSEYIISQLITQCLAELEIDGVAYISNQVQNDTTSYPFCINLAVPMIKNTNNEYSEFAKQISYTSPINFAEFKHLKRLPRQDSRLMSFATLFDSTILSYMNGSIHYRDLDFSDLDDFLYNEDYSPVKF